MLQDVWADVGAHGDAGPAPPNQMHAGDAKGGADGRALEGEGSGGRGAGCVSNGDEALGPGWGVEDDGGRQGPRDAAASRQRQRGHNGAGGQAQAA